MDEVAFVESLFAPEMRSAVASFPSTAPCGRVKTLMAERTVATPPTSNGVPPPPNSLLGGGIVSHFQAPFQPPSEDTPLFVRLNEDDMFSQMLNDQDFPDFHFKKEQETAKPPTSTNSLLLEPLDLPRSNDSSVKDTFYNVETNMFQQFRTPPSSGSMRGICAASPSNFESNMPVFPLGNQTPYFTGFASFPPWQDNQDVSTPGSSNFQRVHTMKHMMAMATMGMSSPMHQPSPGSVDMFNPAISQQNPGLWISTRNNLPETPNGKLMKPSLEAIKTSVERPPFSLTISPPASLTNKALKELIVSADFATPPMASRPKRARTDPGTQPKAKVGRTQENHMGRATGKVTKGKKCIEAGCTRRAQSNSRCKAHGGGARCQFQGPGGCNRSSQGGGFCRAHGGGKRCEFPGCTRGQQRKGRCYVHGGIRKCQYGSCEKKDRGNGFCISHGGGKRCEHPGCSRAVRRGQMCQIHETQEKEGESVAL
ncbi:hypothetical protein PHMEG_0005940 [Phytophthora megakarya]|uniref:WRKY transcription factor 19 n=1 Tax=Phytophthora megakarya TaxID=4795 RepID=A0A225WRS0_9STRA|nr:hypothetical protein PHMEG_0005940 [Phytophthora megakarya]